MTLLYTFYLHIGMEALPLPAPETKTKRKIRRVLNSGGGGGKVDPDRCQQKICRPFPTLAWNFFTGISEVDLPIPPPSSHMGTEKTRNFCCHDMMVNIEEDQR
jgi:hypothetical protein